MDTIEIKKSLIKIGLNNEEIEVILFIAENENAKMSDISDATKIARSTLYRLIDNLEGKGLIKKKLTTQGNKLSIASLENLRNQLTEKQVELNNQITQFDSLTDSILSLNKLDKVSPEVRYFEGKEGVRQLIWNSLKADKEIKCYTNAIRKEIVGEKWLTDYCMQFVKNSLSEKVLGDTLYSKDSYQKFGGREKYYLPFKEYFEKSDERVLDIPFLKIKGEIYLYNNVFAFYTWESEKLIGCEIQSEFIFQTQSSIFDVLWNLTSKKSSIDLVQ
jgi:sugar-specific transcriptional regulator TrmB